MPNDLGPGLARGAAGFAVGLAAWLALSAPYARVLAALSEPILRLAEHPPVTRLVPRGTELTVERSDFPPRAPRPGLALKELTFNVILLTTLFAVGRNPLRDRNVLRLLAASAVMVAVHVAAVVVNVQSIYALRLGPWSEAHYGAVARNVWAGTAHFYSLVGVFGAGFALWWLFRSPAHEELPGGSRLRVRA